MFECVERVQTVRDLGYVGFVYGMYGKELPCIPEEVSDLFVKEEWIKESVSIQYLSLILVIQPTKSWSLKIRQKSSLNQTSVKGVLAVGLQKPSAK